MSVRVSMSLPEWFACSGDIYAGVPTIAPQLMLALIERSDQLQPGAGRKVIEPHFGPLDGRAAERVAHALATAPLDNDRKRGARGVPLKQGLASFLGASMGSTAIEMLRTAIDPARAAKAFGTVQVQQAIDRIAGSRGRNAAKVEQIRTRLGAPTQALRVATD